MAILFAIRAFALDDVTLELPVETKEIVARVDPDFSGSTYADLFESLGKMCEPMPAIGSAVVSVELGAYALVARNCADSDVEEKVRLSQFCTEHCMQLLKETAFTRLEITGNADLNWLRQTDEFLGIWPTLEAGWEDQ